MNANTSKERSFYTQGHQFVARVLFIVWLLASVSPEGALATPKRQMVPATTTSPQGSSLVSTPPTPPPGGILQLPPDSPGAFWGDSIGSSPSIDAALQERMSQEAALEKGCELPRTFPGASPVSEHLPFEARGGESVRFHYQMGQWRAEVSSHIGAFSRRAVLPVVCSQGEDIASSLEILSKYPSWYSQRQIHVLARNVCPTLGEVVYVGELGLKGGGEGEALKRKPSLNDANPRPVRQRPCSAKSGSNPAEADFPSTVDQLKTLASDPQIDQQPGKLVELGNVLLKLAASKQEAGASAQDLSLYTEAAILYQHVLSICEQKADTLSSQAASTLGQSAYQGLAQTQAAMLALAKGVAPRATTSESVKALRDRIEEDKQSLEATRTKARKEVEELAASRDKQGSEAEVEYIVGSKKLFADIAEASKKLLANFYQAGEEELKAAGIERPFTYAIMGLGSIALQQTTPYSDLEFAILMEDIEDEAKAEACREYLRKLTHLVHFRVINLGETVLPFSEYKVSLDHLGRKGLNFDLGGKTPLGRKDKDRADKNKGYELIQPVAGMMAYLKNKDNKMEHIDKLLPYILERTCYMYGDRGLHDRYLASQKEFWSSCQDAAGKHAYQERMRKVLLEGITELDHSQPGVVKAGRKQAGNLRTVGPKLHPEDAGRLYDVKQEIYRLPDRLLYGLAMYFGICPESAWDAVDKLKDKHIIGVEDSAKQASHRLKYAVSFATMLRLDTYLCHRQQNEKLSLRGSLFQGESSGEGSSQAVHKFFLLPQATSQEDRSLEDSSLFKYYYTALALHREMNGFFKVLHLRSQIQPDRDLPRMLSGFSPGGQYTAGKEKSYFWSSSFYDTSCAAKLAIYNRLLHYEQAAKCAEGHLEKVKAGYNKKKLARAHHNLGVSYYHLGSFDKSFDHFDNSLRYLKELYPDGDPQVAAVLRSLGIAHYNLSEFQESLEHFERSLKMLQDLYRENNPETAQALVSVGAAHEQLESFQQSIKHKQEALAMFRALYGKSHPEVARALLSLGESYALDGNLAASLDHKQDALEMFKDLCGKSHPEVARALLSLGDVYAALENFEASLEHKQEALEMFRAFYGRSHPEVGRALLSLGESYEAMDQLAESKEYKNKSVAMLKVFYKDTHFEVNQASQSLSRTKSTHISVLEGGNPVHTTGPSLPRVRTVYPQHLALLSTPRHGQEPEGENTLLRDYYSKTNFPYVKSLFDEHRSRHVQDLECQLMLLEQKQVISFEAAMQLRTLALQGPTPEVRKKNIKDLISLVQPSSGESETSVRAGLLNGLALVATQSQLYSDREAEAAMAGKALEGLTAKAPADHWLAAETLPDKLQHFQKQVPQPIPHEQDRLFIRVRRASSPATTDRADHVAKYYERLEWVKTPLGSEDLFKKRSIRPGDPEKEINRILLTGDPGTGKTTLSRQLAYQWSQGLWGQEFHTLYLLPVRSLQQSEYDGNGYDRKKTLSTAIVNNCFVHDLPATEDAYNSLRDHIDQELDKSTTLVILDGLDERAGACKEILIQAQAGTHKLLMLSRPYGIETERQTVDIEIEHVGFNRAQLKAYVQSEVLNRYRSAELLGYIGKHENIRSIAHIPVNLQILCALWQDEGYDVREVAQQGSLPGLYRLVTDFTWQRYTKKWGLEDESEEELFDTLGQIGLAALQKGEVLISPGLVHQYAKQETAKAKLKDAGFLLLQYVGEDADRQRGFYEFPHLTFQEYFAGRALAQQCLSKEEEEREKASDFLSAHKYESQYGRTLSFMAGEVSRVKRASGIEKLLGLLEKEKEIVGVQHLLLQLQVVHEWLCIASEQEAERGMNKLEDAFQVLSSLEEWFVRAFAHVRLEGYNRDGTYLPGYRLLGLLKSLLQTFGSIARHAPGLLELFKKAAQGPHGAVRLAAVDYLRGAMAGVYDEVRAILQAMVDDDHESYGIQRAAGTALREATGAESTQDEAAVGGGAAQGSLGEAREFASQSPEALLAQLRQAAQTAIYEGDNALRSSRGSLAQAVVAASPEELSVLLELLLPAAQDWNGLVRAAAQEVLLKASLEDLLAFYWFRPDARLIPYITPRLYHTPLVIAQSVRSGHQRVFLYAAAGQAREWRKPQGVVADFERHVQDAVSQLSHVESKLSARIDKSVWEQYFGSVGEEPRLPDGIEAILNSPCPFWGGCQVRDTHLLVLIPKRVSGQELTLDYLGELIKSPQGNGHGTKYRFYYVGNIGNQSPDSSYWVLITRDVLPGSRAKSYADQCALLSGHAKRTGISYEVPGTLEAAVVTLLHHVRSGERLYSDNPDTYTRCRESVDDLQLAVGGFSSGGLLVNNTYICDYSSRGVSALRKF